MASSENNHVMYDENYSNNGSSENGTYVSQSESSSHKRRRLHTESQIDGMEAYFNQCPHPNDQQIIHLAGDLGLDHVQVKFWFQNKQTPDKSQDEPEVNYELRTENENFVADNRSCTHGGNPAVLKQIEESEGISETYIDKTVIESSLLADTNSFSQSVQIRNMSSEEYFAYLKRFAESNLPSIKEVAETSIHELITLIQAREPFWIPHENGKGYILNEEEYINAFPTAFNLNNWRSEGSMFSSIIMVSPLQVVNLFMDVKKWLSVYPNFVSEVKSIYQPPISSEGTKDGDIQLMSVEFQVPCPVVPTRKFIFMRSCKQLSPKIWSIVDFSLYNLLPETTSHPSSKCLRFPSGCIIQEMPNGLSKVTWVEHVAENDEFVHHLVAPILQSVYGATSWLSIFQRQLERIVYTTVQISGQEEGRRSILILCERMCRAYYGGASASDAYKWVYISGDGFQDPKIMKKDNVNDTRMPLGVIVSASLCVQLPILPGYVFDYIRNESTRAEWDDLCDDGSIVQKSTHCSNGHEGNCVTVLRVLGNEDQQDFMILQETNTDITSSSLIYAPLDMDSVMTLLSDESNVDKIGILPSGFTIIPSKLPMTVFVDGRPTSLDGTLLTASFQISINSYPYKRISVHSIEKVKKVVQRVIQNIYDGLMARTRG